jgi:hypothetical protein
LFPWLNSNEIGLSGALATEWEHIQEGINRLGSLSSGSEDTLLWTGGDMSGVPSVKFFYWAILSTKNLRILGWMEKSNLAMENSIKNQTFYMVGSGRKDTHLGYSPNQRKRRTWFMLFMQKRIRNH